MNPTIIRRLLDKIPDYENLLREDLEIILASNSLDPTAEVAAALDRRLRPYEDGAEWTKEWCGEVVAMWKEANTEQTES